MQKFKFLINNEWVDAVDGETYKVIDPSKNEPIAEVALANEKDVDRAVKAAREAFESGVWSELDAGTVWMNTNLMSKIEAPYGGNKDSGLGREDGTIGLKEYLKVKNNILFVGKEYDNFYGFKD